MERLGIVDELRAKQDAVASRLSPTARHQAFPNKFARPLPRDATKVEDPTPPLRAEIAGLKVQLAEVKLENIRLLGLFEDLRKPLNMRPQVPVQDVTRAFVDAMNAAGLTVDDKPWTPELLVRVCRAPAVSRPRMVAIWLVRTICIQPSLPQIGRAFGGKDHTTILHAIRRAPQVMALNPSLRAVAVFVLKSFGASTGELEEGGRP